jgi:hypothetical protein
MKEKISGPVAVAIIVVVAVLVVYFGWRKVSGGPDADVTQETINRYQKMSQQTFGSGGGAGGASGASGGSAGQMTHGAPPPGAAK